MFYSKAERQQKVDFINQHHGKMTATEMALRTGLHKTTVHRIKTDLGLKQKNQGEKHARPKIASEFFEMDYKTLFVG